MRAWLLHTFLWCVMGAVAYAPVATAFQMRSQQMPATTSHADAHQATKPCHGAAAVAVQPLATAHQADQVSATYHLTDMGSCTCTPWCHAALAAAEQFEMHLLAPILPEPSPRFGPNITADVAPLLKPPQA